MAHLQELFDRTQSGTPRFSRIIPISSTISSTAPSADENEQMAMGSVVTHQRNLDLKIYLPYTME